MSLRKILKRTSAFWLIMAMVFQGVLVLPQEASAATMTIRQELNILNGYLGAPSGSYATSSEMIGITDQSYSTTTTTYYFEVVASTTSATNATVSLVNATSSAVIKSITINGTSYARYRSTAFTPISTTTVDYKVVIGNESVGKGLIAARVIVLQSADPLLKTETQIDIGNNETYTSAATTTFSSPKYWYYDSARWDGTPMFYAEVVYASLGVSATSSITYSTAGTYSWTAPKLSNTLEIGTWGAGGAGFDGDTGGGGAAGGGGAFASSTIQITGGTTYTLVVGEGGNTSAEGGTDTTFGGSLVVADAGTGGTNATTANGTGGTVANSTGQFERAGGNGGDGANGSGNNDQGGGGGGAGGPQGVGGTGGDASTSVGGGGGGGNGGNNGGTPTGGTSTNGGAGGAGGNAGACVVGTDHTSGGGGGGGADNGLTGCNGGTYGAGGGGGETGQGNGRDGAIIIKSRYMPATTTITLQESDGTGDGFTGWTDKVQIVTQNDTAVSAPTRVRSLGFIPVSGRNYRIVFRNNYSGATQAIYSAKIIVSQSKGWDISTGTYANKFLDVNTQEGSPDDVFISPDGTQVYVNGSATDDILQYTLTTPWDMSTGSYSGNTMPADAQETSPDGMTISHDGTKAYVVGGGGIVYQYNLTTPWNISTGSYSGKTMTVSTQDNEPRAMRFSPDGKKAYMIGSGNGAVFQYNLTTAWDVSTGSYANKTMSVLTQEEHPDGLEFSPDGSKVYVVGDNAETDIIYQYSLTTPWDLSTGSYANKSLSVNTQDAASRGLALSSDGTKAYVIGSTVNRVHQYTIGGESITKLEPQYLLANTPFKSGTSLQDFLTSFNSSEWNTTNIYYYEVNSADNSTSVVTLNTSGGTLISGSTVTSPDNRGRSSNICSISNGDLDTKATTNNNDIYGTRILVQVGNTDSCVAVGNGTRVIRLRGNARLKGTMRLR